VQRAGQEEVQEAGKKSEAQFAKKKKCKKKH